jgi:ATP-dependent Lhr-like helicase
MIPARFHPTMKRWFEARFGDARPRQREAWEHIGTGQHTLVCAPTGSGKTLAAFLHGIDELIAERERGPLPDLTRIIYVTPLKALDDDMSLNLKEPLAEIDAIDSGDTHCQRDKATNGTNFGKASRIRGLVRTGDTPASAHQAMQRKPPRNLVTTPESLFVLLTSDGGREMLKTARTVIVDEIHAVTGNKRGAHLALSLERLDALAGTALQRIGLSGAQRPIERLAQFKQIPGSPLGSTRARAARLSIGAKSSTWDTTAAMTSPC